MGAYPSTNYLLDYDEQTDKQGLADLVAFNIDFAASTTCAYLNSSLRLRNKVIGYLLQFRQTLQGKLMERVTFRPCQLLAIP